MYGVGGAMDSTIWYEAFVKAANYFAVNVNALKAEGTIVGIRWKHGEG